ncbi:2-hydroxy-3-oxopropionate reductase [bacterium YEK0313]|nr:2-hydroxy-3-oxopropionate reductase [bacterium YEK0313]
MTEVTVIGLGEMGSALAAAFLRAGRKVTVWNRTPAKAATLAEAGAALAGSPAEAVAASRAVVICLSDYAATRAVLDADGVAATLGGRTLVQLSTGTPKEARDLDAAVRATGARYLDGGILAWPSHIGGDATLIYMSGSRSVYEIEEPLLRQLAGGLTFLGEDAGAAAAMFAAVLSYLAGRWIGICHGARIAQAEGLGVAGFGEALAALAPALAWDARHMGVVIETQAFSHPQSTLKTAAGDITRLVRHAADSGIDDEWPRFAADLFQRAVAAGYGAEEHAALVKIMR